MLSVSKIKNNSELKTILTNFSYLTVLQIAGYIFPLITMPYLARVIGVEGFSKIAFAAAIISWIQTIADWGFNYTATRDVAQNRSDSVAVSRIFSNVLWSRLFLTSLSLIILVALIFTIPSFRENASIILVTFILIPGHIFFPDWFFQALERMKYITIMNIIIKLIFTLLVFVFIKTQSDYILQPLFTSIGYLLCGAVSFFIILKKWGYQLYRPCFLSIISTIRQSTDVFVNNIAPNLYNSVSVILLGSVCGGGANGIFEGGNKLISIANQFISIISRAIFPFLSRRIEKHHIYAKINMSITVLASLVIFIFAPFLIRILLSPEFSESIVVLRILSISMIFLVMSNTYGVTYLMIQREERILRNITLVCSLIGMFISYPLISAYSYIGAAITIFISRFLLGVVTYFYARKVQSRSKSNE